MLRRAPALSMEGEPIRPMLCTYRTQHGDGRVPAVVSEREEELSRVGRVIAGGVVSALMLPIAAFPALAIGDGPTPAGECANSTSAVGTPQGAERTPASTIRMGVSARPSRKTTLERPTRSPRVMCTRGRTRTTARVLRNLVAQGGAGLLRDTGPSWSPPRRVAVFDRTRRPGGSAPQVAGLSTVASLLCHKGSPIPSALPSGSLPGPTRTYYVALWIGPP